MPQRFVVLPLGLFLLWLLKDVNLKEELEHGRRG